MTAIGEVSKHHDPQRVKPYGLVSHGASFPVSLRLTKPMEFRRVFQKSTVSSDDLFKVLARLNNKNGSRLGMAVSRQVDRRAVQRNRIKRLIRESFRHSFNAVEGTKSGENVSKTLTGQEFGLDIVVLPRRLAATTSNERLIHSLELHWTRVSSGAIAHKLSQGG